MKKSLANVIHIYGADDEGRKKSKVIYIENFIDDKGKVTKDFRVDENPMYTFFISKKDNIPDCPVNYVKKEDIDSVTVLYDNLTKKCADITNQKDYFRSCIDNRNFYQLNRIHNDKRLHLSDMDLSDYKIREWIETTPKEEIGLIPLSKAFFDIEVDIINHDGFPNPEEAPCPVNLISYMYQPTMELHSFILRNTDNESQTEFLEFFEENEEDYVKELINEMNTASSNGKKTKYEKINKIHFHIFDNEVELITHFFNIIKADKPDYGLTWNGAFDLVTMKNRLLKFRKNPEKIMCPAEFPYKNVRLEQDLMRTDFSKRKSTLEIAGYTQYVDLLECYASIRSTMGKRESYTLDAILLEEIGESKYEYEGDIKEAVYLDFEGFMKYSLYDSFRLYQLEEKNKDVDLLYGMSTMTATRFKKVMTKTTSIRNFAAMILEKQGYILSNNHNRFTEKEGDKKKFRGAWVALPEKMDRVGVKLNGQRSKNIFENLVDLDLTALYPSIILAFNIDADTMLGLVEKVDGLEIEGDEIASLLSTGNPIIVGNRLLGLPSFEEVLKEINHD